MKKKNKKETDFCLLKIDVMPKAHFEKLLPSQFKIKTISYDLHMKENNTNDPSVIWFEKQRPLPRVAVVRKVETPDRREARDLITLVRSKTITDRTIHLFI